MAFQRKGRKGAKVAKNFMHENSKSLRGLCAFALKAAALSWHRACNILRTMTGDDAYEHYLAHWRAHHASEGAPLDRKAFFRAETERKWNGVRRCC